MIPQFPFFLFICFCHSRPLFLYERSIVIPDLAKLDKRVDFFNIAPKQNITGRWRIMRVVFETVSEKTSCRSLKMVQSGTRHEHAHTHHEMQHDLFCYAWHRKKVVMTGHCLFLLQGKTQKTRENRERYAGKAPIRHLLQFTMNIPCKKQLESV